MSNSAPIQTSRLRSGRDFARATNAWIIQGVAVALAVLSCAGASQDSKPSARDIETVSRTSNWNAPIEVVGLVSIDEFLVPMSATTTRSGHVVIVWTEGQRGRYRLRIADGDSERWRVSEVAGSDSDKAPVPCVAVEESGTATFVAWEESRLMRRPVSYVSRRDSIDGPFSPPIAVAADSAGGVSIDAHEKLRLAFARGVRKLNLRKLAGDVIHAPPLDTYLKVAIGTIAGSRVDEEVLLEDDNVLECDYPALSWPHVVYYRDGRFGKATAGRDLVYRYLADGSEVESLAGEDEISGSKEECCLAVTKSGPCVAFETKRGAVFRSRGKDGWTPPIVALPSVSGISLLASGERVIVAGVEKSSTRIRCASTSGSAWESFDGPGSADSLVLSGGGGIRPLVVWSDGGPKRGSPEARNPLGSHRRVMVSMLNDVR
jgi:hypothetical protein